MADAKISALNEVTGTNLDDDDLLAIVNSTETKKVKFKELISTAGLNKLTGTPIPSAKVAFASGAIVEASMATDSVNTEAIKNNNVTGEKFADHSTTLRAATAPTAEFIGQFWVDTDDDKLYVWDGSNWDPIVAGTTSVLPTSASNTIPTLNITAATSNNVVTLSGSIPNTDAANKFLAGPTGAGGAVSARVIAGSDLPNPTTSAKGGVIINGNGLTQTSGTIKIDNSVTAHTGSPGHLVKYDANGLITSGAAIAAGDLPVATSSAVGGVKIGSGLSVSGAGEVTITNSVTGATKAKITYNSDGLVTAGADLVAGDIPAHSAALLTSGTLDIARIGGKAVTAAKLANSSTCIIQSIAQAGFPTAEFTGQLCFDSVAEDAYLWDGNAWQAITTLTKGSLVNGGTFNASTSKMASVTTAGSAAGLVVGSNLPTASATTDGVYVVVATAGTPSSPAPAVSLNPPDYVLGVTNAAGSSWNEIDLSATVSGQTGSNVSFTPYGQVSSTNIQDAIEEIETEKMPKAGGTFTGAVEIGHGGSLSFEGATNDAYETSFAITDPTADRTITLPNASGTVLLAGGASIVNADISTSAAIDYSKLAALADGKILVGNGSNVPTAVTPSGDITISNTGVAAIGSGVIVNADINASAAIAGSKIAAASTSAAGAVQLSDSATSTSTSLAATANRIKVLTDEKAALAGATFTGDVNLGVDDTGVDLKLFGATASAYILWDASADALKTGGTATIDIVKDKLKIDSTAVTTTAAELNVLDGIPGTLTATELGYVDGVTSAIQTQLNTKAALAGASFTGAVNLGVDDTGVDLKMFGDTASAYILWDASADELLTGGGATINIVKDKLKIAGTAVTTTAAELNLLSGKTAIGDASTTSAQTFTKTQSGTVTTQTTTTGTLTLNLNTSTNNHSINKLTGAFTLANPSAMTAGTSGFIKFTQAASPITPSWGTYWHFPGGSASADLTQTEDAVDLLVYTVVSASSIICDLVKDVKD